MSEDMFEAYNPTSGKYIKKVYERESSFSRDNNPREDMFEAHRQKSFKDTPNEPIAISINDDTGNAESKVAEMALHDRSEDMFSKKIEIPFSRRSMSAFSPMLSVDFTETPQEYLVCIDLPGVLRDDLEVMISFDTLLIKAVRKTAKDTVKGNIHLHEENNGVIERSVTLPANADSDRADAKLDMGVLTVTIPKRVSQSRKLIVD